MTAEAEAVSPTELSSLPTATLSASQLGDLELLLSGAFAPLTGFMTRPTRPRSPTDWQLADGTPFPAIVTLDLPGRSLSRPAPSRPTGCCSPTPRARRSRC